ncbi:hypothetical protein T552_02714 [Pneumocystis carinii B80]|uniref:Uncharacterized protein n=1 Tax=Pneumocystis carinii (strain B80) TaxID=1408658 RepID=A0A0W4ZEA1_PNEC8|nr:hypothetical protein T552_02714 [Pneumocystis carinii B80]KTW26708.1 hypothetical protein T552_02714 [Pneumocystis carinii B80]
MFKKSLSVLANDGNIPKFCPTALIVGSVFEHLTSYLVYGPFLGRTWQRAMILDKNTEFWASKKTVSAGLMYGVSFLSSSVQVYAMAALLKLTGSLKYKSAFYLSSLVFAATTLPNIVSGYFIEKRPKEYVLVKFVSGLTQTVGLSFVLASCYLRCKN